MAKIYISSTYEDLKEYREEVYRSLQKTSHTVIAMENYGASDERPLDKCLRDVESCDIYVGIFAWRYGYIPEKDNLEQKLITELEWRQTKPNRGTELRKAERKFHRGFFLCASLRFVG